MRGSQSRGQPAWPEWSRQASPDGRLRPGGSRVL